MLFGAGCHHASGSDLMRNSVLAAQGAAGGLWVFAISFQRLNVSSTSCISRRNSFLM